MRDTNDEMIEIVDAFKDGDNCFVTIKLKLDGETLRLKFGVQSSDYSFVKRILEYRPFENTGVGLYRYFFAKSYSKDSKDEALADASFRVEQLKRHKQFDFKVGRKFLANLLWFDVTKDRSAFEHLIVP